MITAADMSPCGRYRYTLTRGWSYRRSPAIFIMLNPSTADASQDDPTIRRCLSFARGWGCGGIIVLNLFGLRATDPQELTTAADPIGPENDRYLHIVANRSRMLGWNGPVVAAWGAKAPADRVARVRGVLEENELTLQCLGITKSGAPRHPLYVPGSCQLRPWTGLPPR